MTRKSVHTKVKWSSHSFFLHTRETWQPLSVFWKQPQTSAKSVNVRKAFTLGSCCKTTTAQLSTTQHCWKDKLDFLLTSRVVGLLPRRCHYAQLLPGLTGPTVWKIGRCQTGKRGANMFLHRRASTVLTATDRVCVWIDPKSRCSTRPERVCNLSNVWFCRKTKKYFFTCFINISKPDVLVVLFFSIYLLLFYKKDVKIAFSFQRIITSFLDVLYYLDVKCVFVGSIVMLTDLNFIFTLTFVSFIFHVKHIQFFFVYHIKILKKKSIFFFNFIWPDSGRKKKYFVDTYIEFLLNKRFEVRIVQSAVWVICSSRKFIWSFQKNAYVDLRQILRYRYRALWYSTTLKTDDGLGVLMF